MKKGIFNKTLKGAGVATILLLAPAALFAQGGTTGKSSLSEEDLLLGLAIFLCIALIFSILGLLLATMGLARVIAGKPMINTASAAAGAVGTETAQEGSFWSTLKQKLSGAVPVEQEEKVMTDHEYDGIRELDNSLPPWWVYMFYATIVFSVVYLGAYHLFGWGQLQDQEYQTEIAEAKAELDAYMAAKGGSLDEHNVTLVEDEAKLADGKSIYEANCTPCHGADLQGTVGPNLADSYWIHGGSVGDVFKTIRDGVPSKGMISWKAQLSPTQIQNLSSYIISMEGTNPANAKEPQGELFER